MVLKEALAVNVPVVFTEVGDAKLTAGNTKGCFLTKRTPHDVAFKLEAAIKCKDSSDGRKRVLEIELGLSEIAKKTIKIYRELSNAN